MKQDLLKVALKDKIISALELMLAICMVLECGSVYTVLQTGSLPLSKIIYIISLIMLLFVIKRPKMLNIKKVLLYIFAYLLYQGIYIFANVEKEYYITYFMKFVILFIALLTVYCNNKESVLNILKKIVNVVCVLAVISLILYIFGTMFHIIKPTRCFTN